MDKKCIDCGCSFDTRNPLQRRCRECQDEYNKERRSVAAKNYRDRKRKQKQRQEQKRIFTPEEWDVIIREAQKAGITPHNFIRKKTLSELIIPKPLNETDKRIKQVVRISPDGNEKIYISMTEAGKDNNVYTSTISRCVRFKRKDSKGNRWILFGGQ